MFTSEHDLKKGECPVLINANEHWTCMNYRADVGTGFRIMEAGPGRIVTIEPDGYFHLLFFKTGECRSESMRFSRRIYFPGQMLLLPRNYLFKATAVSDMKIVDMSFDKLLNRCDKLQLEMLVPICKSIEYAVQPVTMKKQIIDFLNLITECIESGLGCAHYHVLKHQELMLYIKAYYTKEEIATLFYPVIMTQSDFKEIIYSHPNIYSVNEMANAANMNRTTFLRRFKEEFGETAGIWIKKRLCQNILYECSNTKNTIKDIVYIFNFSSQSSFNRFCRRYFRCTPGELVTRVREGLVIREYESCMEEK